MTHSYIEFYMHFCFSLCVLAPKAKIEKRQLLYAKAMLNKTTLPGNYQDIVFEKKCCKNNGHILTLSSKPK